MKLLVLQHVPHEHPGYIADYAKEKNIRLDIIELWKPYTIPSVSDYAGVIFMGGPMGVYEEFPSKNDEIALIQKYADTTRMLGMCLGSQLMAHALGAKVYPNIRDGKRIKEVGYFSVKLTEEGKQHPVFAGFPRTITVLQWHGDIFDLPQNAERLAASALCENQAFGYKKCFGSLFHFEFTPEMVKNQIGIDTAWIHTDNELDEDALLRNAESNRVLMKEQCYRLLDNFLSL
ncbi:type 1 glutamine amidotransferase [Candidatus Kaiserbacteria bacterium]|nr:type 1 glutamine amidotransferase [Candidatus Kaiserbacteria bacterium]